MAKTPISSTEAGIIAAIGALSLYLRSRPDHDEEMLQKYVNFFISTRPADADEQAFNLPLRALGADPSHLEKAIQESGGAKPR
ncbi:hypothetical protein IRZ48_05515 [Pseudomonas fulva]|uniref:hypothetical protein n=1 Tax=Pseudomonas fulva TaxID=47880 RepID=UPI0018A96DE9|nr:hypothetical protein [Pseudomonas fulva]MBF8636087.1 hypothetical protein [Pseudomonas fulva]MBF8688060.1 hypothetical protein [Pseudomonas fulva]